MSDTRHSVAQRHRRSDAYMCGKSSTGSYDPQVGEAASEEAQTAQQAENFGENYYTTTMAPLVAAETQQANTSTSDQNAIFNVDYPELKAQANEYTQYGLPAATTFYNQAANYNTQQEQNSEATAAIGDQNAAAAANAASLARQQQAYGINPTSGAAVAASSAASVNNAAAAAAAATRARYNAKTLGMQLTADAANFSQGGVANINSTSGTSGTAANGALGAAAAATQSATGADQSALTGYQLAGADYGANLSAYANLDSASIAGTNAGWTGLGQGLGTIAGALTKAAGV